MVPINSLPNYYCPFKSISQIPNVIANLKSTFNSVNFSLFLKNHTLYFFNIGETDIFYWKMLQPI